MALYRAAFVAKAGTNTANTPFFELKNATTQRLNVVEFGFSVATAPTTAPQFAVVRSTAQGTISTAVSIEKGDPADTATSATSGTAWSVAPTYATTGPFILAQQISTTIGSGYVWVAPSDRARIVVPTGGSLIFTNLVASGATLGAFNGYVAWEE